ncbi:Six-hairpin glycosidase-like protein [Mycena floridula]|nr:Six-hairpin glycosidase-like protein [Mycena floridula]
MPVSVMATGISESEFTSNHGHRFTAAMLPDDLQTSGAPCFPDGPTWIKQNKRKPSQNSQSTIPTMFPLRSTLMLCALAVSPILAACPDYTTYSQSPHGTPSTGPLALPFMRPDPACRTFNSSAVEAVIGNMTARLKDPDLARLFENTFPNTLDTTVKYFNAEQNLAFIITGDITAQWLRDTANQFAHYHSLLAIDPELATLVKAVINNEARYVAEYPYCGSFQPPPESGLAPTHNDWADGVTVNPPVNNQTVFECKYEIDSLCGFIKLSRSYYDATKDSSFMNANWFAAINQIFRVINEQSQPSFDENFNFISYYNWTGGNGALSPAVPNSGNGEPKAYTGMVGTHHRPSDDISVFAFLTPANAMLSVELSNLADILDATHQAKNISTSARTWSKRIHDAIWDTTVVNNIFAYETNGFGGRYVMDDANVPSLLSLPYLGFLNKTDPAYVATREVLLSAKNPYFSAGKNFSGTGGPHVNAWHPWPMSQISAIFGTDDDQAILKSLYTIANNTDGLGLIHESQSIYSGTDYTRPWFAWANSFFAEMLLDLADRKPHLIFKENVGSYKPGQ